MEFVVVLHLEPLQLHRGMVMVACLERLLMVLVVLYQEVRVGHPFQDETDWGEVELQLEVRLVTRERQMLLGFLESLEIQSFDHRGL